MRGFVRARTALGATVLLFLLPYLLFWQVWLPPAPQRTLFADGDFVEQNVAMRRFVAGELREGRLPLWDPYTYAGQPALSGSLFAPYYPLGWWQAAFPFPFPDWVLPVEVLFHLGIGGVGMFVFVRRLTDNNQAALISGITFQLSGWATGYPMLQVGILETAVWLPWGLWAIERGITRRTPADFVAAAFFYGIALLAGHPQTLMYLAYLSAAYYVLRGWQVGLNRQSLLGALIIGLGVLGIGAAQWLPALEAYQFSPRLGLSYAEVGNGFTLVELWGILRQNREGWSPLYIGQSSLFFAWFALFMAKPRALVAFWGVVALMAVLLALGQNGFLYPIAYRLLPGFAIFRNQERIALLSTLAGAVLSGYGWAAFTEFHKPRVRRFLLALYVGIIVATLGILAPKPVLARSDGYYPPAPVVAYLRSVGDPTWRISSEGLLPDGPNAGMVYRLRDTVGNSPLHLAALDSFTTELPELRWWQMLNVQHVLSQRTFPDNAPVVPVMSAMRGTLYQIFVNGTPLWITHTYEVAPSQDAAITRTADPTFDPFQTVVLEHTPSISPTTATAPESATVTELGAQHLLSEVTLSAPAVVVWSEIDYPGWQVWVNGDPAEPLRAYGLLRAVALPTGTHTIEWRFLPPLAYGGLGISMLSVLLLTLYAWHHRRPSSPPTNLSANADP